MDYKIVNRDEIKLVGVLYHTTMKTEKGIPGLWDDAFIPRAKEIKHIVNRNCYGLELYPDDFMETWQFTYMAAFEVSKLDDIPINMFGVTLPAATYAAFTVKGKLDPEKIKETFHKIYHEWLPSSGYTFAYPYDFEFYDDENDRFKPDEDDSEIDIYLPIRKK
ncbi:MAG: AraC family transcriptional regulator [Candidatus Cloacimonetes bacterium]|nr:AraC family transcriptional regulator [Candidatus Cloacimonadota bacterium]